MKTELFNEFSKRLITSFILVVLLTGLFSIGNLGVNFLVFILSFFAFLELRNLSGRKFKLHYFIPLFILTYFLITKISVMSIYDKQVLTILYLFSSSFVIVMLFRKSNIHYSIVGFLINSSLFSILYIISNQNLQYKLIFIIISIICFCDIFAYLIGKSIGKNKIFPKISPNKTFEGYIGSAFGSLFLFTIFFKYYELNNLYLIFYVFIIIISSFVGDLYISFFKRKLNVKDSGKIFPGHGGILDRIDSWLFSFPSSFFILQFS